MSVRRHHYHHWPPCFECPLVCSVLLPAMPHKVTPVSLQTIHSGVSTTTRCTPTCSAAASRRALQISSTCTRTSASRILSTCRQSLSLALFTATAMAVAHVACTCLLRLKHDCLGTSLAAPPSACHPLRRKTRTLHSGAWTLEPTSSAPRSSACFWTGGRCVLPHMQGSELALL